MCSKIYNMRSSANLVLGQWKMLFTMFKYSLMQSLNIFRTREGIRYELEIWSGFWILGKTFKQIWAWPSAIVGTSFKPRPCRAPLDRATLVVTALPTMESLPQDNPDSRHPTWAEDLSSRVPRSVEALHHFASSLTTPPSSLSAFSPPRHPAHCRPPPPPLLIAV
jgi:hypothetical protein